MQTRLSSWLAVATFATLPLLIMPQRAAAIVLDSCLTEPGLPCTAVQGDTYGGVTLGPSPPNTVNSPDGNDVEVAIEAVLAFLGTPVDIMPVAEGVESDFGFFDFTPDMITGGNTFNWAYSGPETLFLATVKAGSGFTIFDISGTTSGTLTTTGHNESSEGVGHDVSHVGFWKGPVVQVSEPSSFLLLVSGLTGLGMAVSVRRRQK